MIHITEGDHELALSILKRSGEMDLTPDAESVLLNCMERSIKVCCGWYDDNPACIWGLIPPTVLSDRAYLWLVTSNIVFEHKFLFIRYSQRYVEEMLSVYSLLYGEVAVKNKAAKKWLGWLKAEFGEPSKGFYPFVIRRSNGHS